MGLRLEELRPIRQLIDPPAATVPPIREPSPSVWGTFPPVVKSVSPNLMDSVPAPLLVSKLFKSMCGNGEALPPVLTLTDHTPIEPMYVTKPGAGLLSPTPPSVMVTEVLPSLRYNVATAAAGAGPVNTAAQLSTSAQPIATTALVSFISPPWPICLLNERISPQRSALSRAGVVPTRALLKNPLDSDVALVTRTNS